MGAHRKGLGVQVTPSLQRKEANETPRSSNSEKTRHGERVYLRLAPDLKKELVDLAKRRKTTVQSIVEAHLSELVRAEVAQRHESELAPIIDQLLQDRFKQHLGSFRSLIVRLAHETLRNQFLVLSLMNGAGMKVGDIEGLREEGWRWAVRELKQKAKELPASGPEAAATDES